MNRTPYCVAGIAAALIFAACSDDDTPTDAGVRADASAPLDATARPDALPVITDSGVEPDTGVHPDAAAPDADAPRDAEPSVDAAAPDATITDAGTSSIALTVSGTITGTPLAQSNVVIIWRVTTSKPDHIYGFGPGTATGAAYVATLDDVPPPDALDSDGIGVGTVAYLRAGVAPPVGRILMGPDFVNVIGLSPRHVIIYKAPGANTARPWAPLFPTGYQCGRCVRSTMGGFDTFEPSACDAVRVELPPSGDPSDLDLCNWT